MTGSQETLSRCKDTSSSSSLSLVELMVLKRSSRQISPGSRRAGAKKGQKEPRTNVSSFMYSAGTGSNHQHPTCTQTLPLRQKRRGIRTPSVASLYDLHHRPRLPKAIMLRRLPSSTGTDLRRHHQLTPFMEPPLDRAGGRPRISWLLGSLCQKGQVAAIGA